MKFRGIAKRSTLWCLSYRTLFCHTGLSCHTCKFCHINLFFSLAQIPCHTERSEVSINLERKFTPLRRGFFAIYKGSTWQNPPSLRASFASVAIYKFKRKFTFGLPRICTLSLCKFSQWRIPCHTEALAEVSINLKRVLNSLDFFAAACALQPVGSLRSKWQCRVFAF